MKRLFKILGIALLILIAVFFIMAATQPKDVTIVRTSTIKAPQASVWSQVVYFKNWPNWSPWVATEPTVKLTYEGIDGTAGSNYHWLGDETGEGKMTNTKVADGQMDFDLQFIKPWEGKSEGFIKTEDAGNNETRVTWSMTSHSSFPMNALNFMMEKMIGKDFEKGFELMEKYLKAHPEAASTGFTIEERTFPAQTYATQRKTNSFSEISAFCMKTFPEIASKAKENISGAAACFYYTWDDKTQTTDMAAAFPVKGEKAIEGTTLVNVPESNCCYIVYKGGYSRMGKAHEMLGEYIEKKGKMPSLVLEEYLVGPATEADSNKWITNINYLTN